MPRNTRLAGHGLVGEGSEHWRKNGSAYCECGALSDPGISQAAARRWMAGHKYDVQHFFTGFEEGPQGYTTAVCSCGFGYYEDGAQSARFSLEHDHIYKGHWVAVAEVGRKPVDMRSGKDAE